MNSEPAGEFLRSAVASAESTRRSAERAIAQVTDEQLHTPLPGDHNSIAIIMQHVAGNMRSRWTDFLTTDGEKPWRGRDNEFIDTGKSRDELLAVWNAGWECLLAALESLAQSDLTRQVTTRGHSQTVLQAIQGQLIHYGYHVGQIILIARILAGEKWETMTIPLGQSEQHNQRTWKK